MEERRKHSEDGAPGSDALLQERAFVRTLFESFPAFFVALDQAGRILSMNRAMLASLGYSAGDVVGRDYLSTLVPEDGREAVGKTFKEVVEGRLETVSENLVQARDGRTLLVEWHGCPVVRDDGSFAFFYGVGTDITERRHAELTLADNAERLRLLVQNSNDLMAMTDASGTLTFIGGGVEKHLGRRPEELLGKRSIDLVHPDDREAVAALFVAGQQAPHGAALSAAFRFQHGDGRWVSLEVIATNLLDDEIIHGLVLNIRDVTDRLQAEAEQARLREQLQQAMKMEAIGRLAGGVAHDFNNLLTSILGNTSLALYGLDPLSPFAKALSEVNKAAQSAASLTHQLLAFSRKQMIEPRVVDLNELIAHLQGLLARLIGEDVSLQVVLASGLGAVKVDPAQLEQVLVNLSVNARDAMPHGGKLTIETANVDFGEKHTPQRGEPLSGRVVMLAVTDTGIGMSPETRSRLFEPFFTTKPKGLGTGLGLATIYGAIKQAGGTIEVYSEVGHGTTFQIYLPRAETAAEPLAKDAAATLRLPGGDETVLFVEDDALVRSFGVRLLTQLGYRVLAASTGEEALAVAEKHGKPIDLLMTDVVMPGMNGKQLAEALIPKHPETEVLYASGYTANVIAERGVLEENLHFLAKPYSPQALAHKIRKVLDDEDE